jgi:hypothetical protein
MIFAICAGIAAWSIHEGDGASCLFFALAAVVLPLLIRLDQQWND